MATIHASTAADKPAPHESLLAPALAYLNAGRSVVPIAPGLKTASLVRRDTGESITIRWKPYQNAPASAAELQQWFSGTPPMGIGLVTGPVSGTTLPDGRPAALEVLDFDDAQTLKAFLELAVARGYGALIPQLPFEFTPGGGGHLGYWRHRRVRHRLTHPTVTDCHACSSPTARCATWPKRRSGTGCSGISRRTPLSGPAASSECGRMNTDARCSMCCRKRTCAADFITQRLVGGELAARHCSPPEDVVRDILARGQ
jgi:hypothetical protein